MGRSKAPAHQRPHGTPTSVSAAEVDPAEENTRRFLAGAVFLLQPAKTSASIGNCELLRPKQLDGASACRLYSSQPRPHPGSACTFLPVLTVSAPSPLSPGDEGTPLKMGGCSQGLTEYLPYVCQGKRGHPAKVGGLLASPLPALPVPGGQGQFAEVRSCPCTPLPATSVPGGRGHPA